MLKLSTLDPRLRERIQRQVSKEDDLLNRDTGPVAVVEPDTCDAALATSQVKDPNPRRFLVRVTSHRTRLLDQDNLCEKYHVDCCRYAGLLPGDDPSQTQIEVAQQKVKRGEPEQTMVEVYEVTPEADQAHT